jgi:hypothetical protein
MEVVVAEFGTVRWLGTSVIISLFPHVRSKVNGCLKIHQLV